jgi:hypothetical protein
MKSPSASRTPLWLNFDYARLGAHVDPEFAKKVCRAFGDAGRNRGQDALGSFDQRDPA